MNSFNNKHREIIMRKIIGKNVMNDKKSSHLRDQEGRLGTRTNYKRRYIQKLTTNYGPLCTPNVNVHHQLEQWESSFSLQHCPTKRL